MADNFGLSDQERAELERLRAEKAARERSERDAAERAELERLRRERDELERLRRERAERDADREARKREEAARERGRALMEPDDDLRMPLGQKVVIAVVVGIAVIWLAATIIG